MALRIGTLRGLDACASTTGRLAVLALDHRNNLRRMLDPDDPDAVTYGQLVAAKRAVIRALMGTASGVLLDPELGAAHAVIDGSLPGGAGLIVAVEASGYTGPSTARDSSLLTGWSVSQSKRMGADAVKLLLYYHPDAAPAAHQEQLLIEVAEECADVDMPLFLETLTYSADASFPKLTGEARREVVVRTARRLTALGGDILKCEFPYDPSVSDRGRWREACAELDAASAAPWVLLSGGVDDATFAAQTDVACRAGASGVLVGRSVWAEAATLEPDARDRFLATEGRARLRALVDLVDDVARPWHARPGRLTSDGAVPGDGWYRDY